jgi:hypothetical protein
VLVSASGSAEIAIELDAEDPMTAATGRVKFFHPWNQRLTFWGFFFQVALLVKRYRAFLKPATRLTGTSFTNSGKPCNVARLEAPVAISRLRFAQTET